MAYFTDFELRAMADAGVAAPTITPEMLAYCRTRYLLIGAGLLYSIATLFAILHFRAAALLESICQRITRFKLLQIPLFYLLLVLLITLIRFPFSYVAGFQLDHQYGLSHQSFAGWLADLLKSRGVDALLGALGFTVAFGIIDHFQRRWPLVLWAALVPLIAAGIFVAPLVIDPLFNKFSPMSEGPLRTRIESVATKAGIANAPIFVVDKSRQTTKLNAYVTGLGTSTRIVIWDNTLKKLPADQIEAIVAHEAGHYVLGHIVLGFALIAGGLLALLVALKRLAPLIVDKFPTRWGITEVTQPSAIPAWLLLATVGSYLISPVENGISRAMEHQADAFGLKVTGDGPAMARVFVSLSQQNLAEPAPPDIIQFWFFSHPSLRERVLFSLGIK